MTDRDELLARADAWLARPATLGLPVSLVRGLVEALRVGSATPTTPGRCAFCETPAADCRKRAPAYCCQDCYHPELEVAATPTGDDHGS
jgi:hypothetical protein